jgi:hypothetical protein
MRRQGATAMTKRVLIVNAYFDYDRTRPRARRMQVAQAMGPAYLAGAFDPRLCDIRLHNEQSQGPLTDPHLLGWPDMLVLTGVTNAFDRMRQLTACARTRNPAVIVVAGGPAIRALPAHASSLFDYACTGDVEQMADVIREAFGAEYVGAENLPRYDLATTPPGIGYIETSRNCNFACSFCALTGEARGYQVYDAAYIEAQARRLGSKRYVLLLDNNFFGNDRAAFRARLALLGRLRSEGVIHRWSALVTEDFFREPALLKEAKAAGCFSLFSGVESFDGETLRRFNKRQNTLSPQADTIRRCLEAGVVFSYGLMADLATRTVADIRAELEFIFDSPELTLPSFVTLPIPLLGTPYFRECADAGRLLPNIRLRDMEGSTITIETRDPLPSAAMFVRDLQTFRGYRRRMARHTAGFARRYGRSLPLDGLVLATSGAALLGLRPLVTAPGSTLRSLRGRKGRARTHIATTEIMDSLYTPPFRIDGRWGTYYEPTMVTDSRGRVTDLIAAEVLDRSAATESREAAVRANVRSAVGINVVVS